MNGWQWFLILIAGSVGITVLFLGLVRAADVGDHLPNKLPEKWNDEEDDHA